MAKPSPKTHPVFYWRVAGLIGGITFNCLAALWVTNTHGLSLLLFVPGFALLRRIGQW
jgi:hypothetical protein